MDAVYGHNQHLKLHHHSMKPNSYNLCVLPVLLSWTASMKVIFETTRRQ
jgi:hypothetical protein